MQSGETVMARAAFVAALLLASASPACTPSGGAGAVADAAAASADAGAGFELDQPDEDIPPATAPAGATMPLPGLPAPGAISFAGLGPAAFGDPAEAVRQAWGGALWALPDAAEPCHYLSPPVEADSGYQVAFMIEDGRFVRIDIASPRVAAPGGGRVGMRADELEALYPGMVERRPHEYVEGGQYLRIRDPDGGPGVLLFEADEDGRVGEWRIGLPPQVDYVEGCA
jgi:hypothetical protein